MINILVLGLDPHPVRQYSLDHTANLANLFETSPAEINFVYVESTVFHAGVEQPSWNVIVIVRCDEKYHPLQEAVASYILKTMTLFGINVEVDFEFTHAHHVHEFVNPEYPRFILEENIHQMEVELDEAEQEAFDKLAHDHHHHEEDEEEEPEEEIYLGDAFAPYKDKLEGK